MFSPLHKSLVTYMREELRLKDLIALHNSYVSHNDGEAYVLDHCLDVVTELGFSAEQAMHALYFGDINGWDDYVKFDGDGNLVSVRSYVDLPVDLDTLAAWALEENFTEFTVHLELGDMEWECDDNDTDICDKETMARWVSDSEDYEGDRERLFDELMADGYWWVEWHKVEAD